MLLGLVLLYVGAALLVNGIWLVGQARVVAVPQRELVPEMAGALLGQQPVPLTERTEAAERERPASPSVISQAERHFSYMQGKEIAVINIFTGGVGVVVSTFLAVQGGLHGNRPDIADAAFVLLFAFTYLWIAANQFLGAGGHAFGWFCFFIAVTAVPTAAYTLKDAHGNAASIWLGADWIVWAVLWFMFFLLLALERPIGRIVGWVTIGVALGTAWAFGYSILQGAVSF